MIKVFGVWDAVSGDCFQVLGGAPVIFSFRGVQPDSGAHPVGVGVYHAIFDSSEDRIFCGSRDRSIRLGDRLARGARG
jgi:hypothetical protein